MKPRLDAFKASPKTMQAMLDLSAKVEASGLEHSLMELVKTRASQINGCAHCLNMHTKDAMASGESVGRLFLLDAWREAQGYTDRERAALEWTEALTLIAQTHAPDSAYEALASQFTPDEQVQLTLAITTINAWNRFAVGFRVPVVVEKQRVPA